MYCYVFFFIIYLMRLLINNIRLDIIILDDLREKKIVLCMDCLLDGVVLLVFLFISIFFLLCV